MHRLFRLLFKGLKWFFLPFLEWIFGTEEKLKAMAHQASFGQSDNILKRRHTGFTLTGDRSISRLDSFRNVLASGPTGSGKSSSVFIPSLLRSTDASYIIHDPSGEIYEKTAGYLESRGYVIQVLNFADVRRSEGYNPLLRAKTSAEINKVAAMIIRTSLGDGSRDSFWNLQATSLLGLLISLVQNRAVSQRNLYCVRQLLRQASADHKVIDGLITSLGQSDLVQEWQSFQGFDDKVKAGVIATCLSALQLFSDETVALITSFDSLSLPLLRLRKVVLYIQNPVADSRYYSLLSSLFFEQMFTDLLRRMPWPNDRDVLVLLDEAGHMAIPSLATVSSNVRKYRIGLCLGIQDAEQLVQHYGRSDAETIRSNCLTQIYFPGQGLKSAQYLSRVLGQTSFADGRGPLLSPDQIRMLPTNQAIVIAGQHQPLKVKLKPYYRKRRLLKRSQLPLPYLVQKRPTLTLPANLFDHV